MPIQTDAQREQAEALLKSGRITDSEKKRKLLTSILAYDNMRGEAAPGTTPGTDLVQPAQNIVAQGEATPGKSFPSNFGVPDVPGQTQESAQRGDLRRAATGRGMVRFGQGVADLVKRMGGMSPEEREALAQQRLTEQAEFDVQAIADAKALGMDPKDLKSSQTLGRLIPEVGAGTLAGLPRTAFKRIAAEGLLGGFSAAAEQPFADDAGKRAALWAGIGSGLGTVLEVPEMAEKFITRDAKRVIDTPKTQAGFEDGNAFGVDLSLAEASLDEKVKRIERAIASSQGSHKDKALENRQIQLASGFLRLERMLNPKQLSTQTVASTLQGGYEKYVKGLQKIAGDNMRDNLAEAGRAVGAKVDERGRVIGGEPVLTPNNLISEMKSILKQQRRVPLVSGGPESDVAVQGALKRMVKKKGGEEAVSQLILPPEIARVLAKQAQAAPDEIKPMNLGDLQMLWQFLNERAYSPAATAVGRNQDAIDRLGATNLLKALGDDIDAAAAADGPQGEAVRMLKAARDQYRRDKAPINAMADTAFNKVLSAVGDVNSEEFANSLLKLSTEDISKVMRLADTTKPGLANALRGRMFAELVTKHTKRSAASSGGLLRGDMDVGALWGEFADMPTKKLQALLPVNTDAPALKRAQQGLSVLQRIAQGANVTHASGVKGIVQQIEGYAINAVSQSPFFVARLAAGELSPGYLEKLLYTKEGLRHLEVLGTRGAGKAAVNASVTGLTRLLHESDAELEEARKRVAEEKLQRQQQRVQAVGF